MLQAQLTRLGLPLVALSGLTVNTDLVDGVSVGVSLIAGRFQAAALLTAWENVERGGSPLSPVGSAHEMSEPKPLADGEHLAQQTG